VCGGLTCAIGNDAKLGLHLAVQSFIPRVCSGVQFQVKYCEEATCRNSAVPFWTSCLLKAMEVSFL